MKKKTTRLFAAMASLLVMGALGFTTYSAPITTTEAAASNFVSKYRSDASDAIDALKDASEISGTPAMINGISLQVKDGKMEILGMGHLKFIEY